MIKHRLLSAYENFFIVKKKSSGEYAYLDHNTKITVINEASTFTDNGIDINKIKNTNDARNCAIPMVINFSHEKSGHFKFLFKNEIDSSPIIYFKGIITEMEIIYKNGFIDGETGKILEKFICDNPEIINELFEHFIYGELLESKYFNGNDNELEEAVKKIQLRKENKDIKSNENLQSKDKKKVEKNIFNLESLSELPNFYLHGCFMLDVNVIKKELMIPKEIKEKISKKNYLEKLNKYKKMKEIYDNNKKMCDEKNKK